MSSNSRLFVMIVAAHVLQIGTVADAWAQACCTGGLAVSPARLAPTEDVLVGLQTRAMGNLGQWNARGDWQPLPSGSRELSNQTDLVAAARLKDWQFSARLPWIETLRQTVRAGQAIGGGFGDVDAGIRYDFRLVRQGWQGLGVAAIVGLTVPTGRPVERAQAAQAVDATGTGAWQPRAGMAVEGLLGPWLTQVSLGITQPSTRQIADMAVRTGWQGAVGLAVARVWSRGISSAFSLGYLRAADTKVSGVAIADSGHDAYNVGVSLSTWLGDWRVGMLASGTPPLSGVGHNQPVTAGMTLTALRVWP